MKILLTGAGGFLGRILTETFIAAGHDVDTVGRGDNCTYQFDLTGSVKEIGKAYDMVVHAAGKAHMTPKTPEEKKAFYDVNYQGTITLLQSLEKKPPASFVFISTVAVYGLESGTCITEGQPLMATDPYGESKKMAETYISDWCGRKDIPCVMFRLPLVAGKKPVGNLLSMINAIRKGFYFNIGKGEARRSMVMAEDITQAILLSAGKSGIYHLTDGHHPSFCDLSIYIAGLLGKRRPLSIPLAYAKLIAKLGDIIGSKAPLNSNKLTKMVSSLTFNDDLARKELGWASMRVIGNLQA